MRDEREGDNEGIETKREEGRGEGERQRGGREVMVVRGAKSLK